MSTKEEELQDFLSTKNSNGTTTVITGINTSNAEAILSNLNFSLAAQKIILDPSSFATDASGLESIASSSELLIQIRGSLGDIIDSLGKNPSIISRLTEYWGSLSWWEKVIGGITISGPGLAIGLASNIGFLLTLSSISASAYITGGVLLEDHLFHSQGVTERLKQGIFGIADVLVLTISALNKLCKNLALSIERLKEENDKLSDNVLELSCSVDTLRIEVENSLIIEKELRTTLVRLQETAGELKKNLSENQQAYDLTIKKIELYKRDQLYHEQILKKQIEELRKREAEYKDELEKNKNLTRTLQQTIKKLSKAAIGNEKQHKLFQEKCNKILTAGDHNLSEFVKAEKEFGSLNVQLESSLMRHKMLLEQQGKLLQHLIRVDELIDNPEERDEKVSNTDALCTLGLLAVMPKSKSNPSDEAHIPPIL